MIVRLSTADASNGAVPAFNKQVSLIGYFEVTLEETK